MGKFTSRSCDHPDPALCQRLGRHIHGFLWDVWQGTVYTPERCQALRALWESQAPGAAKLPGLLTRAVNFAKAAVKHVADAGRLTTPEGKAARLALCLAPCERLVNGTHCSHPSCGCPLEKKTSWASESCPEGKWGVEVIQTGEI